MWLIWIVLVLANSFDAIGDGFKDIKKSTLSGVFQAVEILSYLVLVVLACVNHLSGLEALYIGIAFVLVRLSIFDFIRNAVAKQKLFYVGNTKYFDRLMNRFLAWTKQNPVLVLSCIRIFALLFSLVFTDIFDTNLIK